MRRHALASYLLLLLLPVALRANPPGAPEAAGVKLPRCTVRVPGTTVTFDMVKIPAGRVQLEAQPDGPPARVEAVESIWIATTETTWDAYGHWAFGDLSDYPLRQEGLLAPDAESKPSVPYGPPDRGWGFADRPCMGISDYSARMYCQWLTRLTGRSFRLPTEAEWEYACRAGGAPIVQLDAATLDAIAWSRENAANEVDPNALTTHPVARKRPNRWGLYDMLGNVGEWVYKGGAKAPFIKGGSYRDRADRVNSTRRMYFNPSWQDRDPQYPKDRQFLSDAPFAGFRIVCDDDPPPGGRQGR